MLPQCLKMSYQYMYKAEFLDVIGTKVLIVFLVYSQPHLLTDFMYRRPTLCTLHIAVDFLKSLKIAVVLVGGLLLGYNAYIISL